MSFWHDVLFLNRLTRACVMLALIALALAGLRAIAGLPAFAIKSVVVLPQPGTSLDHVSVAPLARTVLPRLSGTLFTVDLGAARAAFESQPWVRTVSVRRAWPDRLLVTLEEHRALARWNDDAGNRFVSVRGEAFDAPGEAELGARLPLLIGPEAAVADVSRRYAQVRERLALVGKEVKVLSLSARHAWSVRVADGLVLELGREQPGSSVLSRLDRFVANYATTVGALTARIEVVDLRYPNGFALRVPALRAATKAEPAAARGARDAAGQRQRAAAAKPRRRE